jgi:hypothetical protein
MLLPEAATSGRTPHDNHDQGVLVTVRIDTGHIVQLVCEHQTDPPTRRVRYAGLEQGNRAAGLCWQRPLTDRPADSHRRLMEPRTAFDARHRRGSGSSDPVAKLGDANGDWCDRNDHAHGHPEENCLSEQADFEIHAHHASEERAWQEDD